MKMAISSILWVGAGGAPSLLSCVGKLWDSHSSFWKATLGHSGLCVLGFNWPLPADPPRVVSLEEPELRLEHCIEFVVRGNPPPTLHWLHNGQPLRESKITHVEYYQEGEVSEGCLLFNKPTHYNNGNYTLIAKNPLGTANQTINGHFLKEPFPGERRVWWLIPSGSSGGGSGWLERHRSMNHESSWATTHTGRTHSALSAFWVN